MFETAELGQKIPKSEFKEREPELRQQLLRAQRRIRDLGIPVILMFSGVDGAGKGATANLLNEWMDPRGILTLAYGEPSEEERERPPFWRYWRDLPGRGQIGIFLGAWYSRPILDHVYDEIDRAELDDRLERIMNFERAISQDGALVLKFWMHLGRKAQKKRFKALEKDPLQSFRVTERDWKHLRLYDRFVETAEHTISRTSTGRAPWIIVEGADERYRSVKVATEILDAVERRVHRLEATPDAEPESHDEPEDGSAAIPRPVTVLAGLDMTKGLEKSEYKETLERYQARLNLLHRRAREKRISTILVFEGWDAGGKGGAIRRSTAALDARSFRVIPIAAPTDEEKAHHYLWRFWRHLPRAGRVTIFDRSWYGRVLVERVEGYATEEEWRRAYKEINDFEGQLVEHGTVLLKFWIHITKDEQAARFHARETTPHKRWKLTEEDWRNRERWEEYEIAVNDMVEHTSTGRTPWVLVEGNDKRYARVKVIRTFCDALEEALRRRKGKKGRKGK